MLRLAFPVLLEQLLAMLVGLVDMWLAGRFLEQQHLAAIGLISYVLWLIPCLFGMVAIGAMAMTARFVGAADWEMARRVTHQAFLAGLVVAILATAAVGLLAAPFVAATQLAPDAAPLAVLYLQILVPAVPAIMVEQVGIGCLRGAGDTVAGLLAMSIVNVLNVAVGAALVTGPLQMGISGLAIGTACGHVAGAIIVAGFLIRGRAQLRLRWTQFVPDLPLMRRLLRIGVPGGLDMVAVVSCHLWFLSIINALGTLQAAAHGLGIRIESLAYLPGTAFQVAAATLAGQYLGAGDRRRATRAVASACLAGGVLMSGAGFVFFFAGHELTAIFLGQQTDEVANWTVPLLKIVAFSMPSLALSMVLTGALRGAGDTRWPLLFTFIGFIGIRIPLAYVLAWDAIPLPFVAWTISGFGLGVIGAWYAMITDIIVRSVLVAIRFWQGGWQEVAV